MLALVVLLTAGISGIALGQDMHAGGPPKVLTVFREYTKPGKSGMAHEKTESMFVQAMKQAKWPTHYLAVESLSGRSACALSHRLRFVCSVGEGYARNPKG